MPVTISCKELGMECDFVTDGETEEVAVESLMRHVHMEHGEDWFEVEECYQAACGIVRKKIA